MAEKTMIQERTGIKVKRPQLYAVIIYNDDYTTMDFVVEVIVQVFHKPIPEATQIMMDVHEKGKGVVGIYIYDIAVTKKIQVEQLAREREFPLKASVEEADV